MLNGQSHIHVSLRNKEGRNIFAVSDAELEAGRENAAYKDTKFISQEAEWFLAGILDGIADGNPLLTLAHQRLTLAYSDACGTLFLGQSFASFSIPTI